MLAIYPVVLEGDTATHNMQKPCPEMTSYLRLSTVGAAGFGLSNALDIVPGAGASFFLLALGFFASRPVLF